MKLKLSKKQINTIEEALRYSIDLLYVNGYMIEDKVFDKKQRQLNSAIDALSKQQGR